jgi:FkbM family methyltransferase
MNAENTNLLISRVALPIFRLAHKFLSGRGLERFSLIRNIYEFLYSRLIPKDTTLMVLDGVKINLPGRDVPSTITANLLMYGVWERFQTKLFKHTIHEGMAVVDIGAHIGYYTLLAAGRVGKKGVVFAFEPDESNYSMLIKNIEQNGYNNVTPVKKAVTSSTGTVRLFLNAKESAEHNIIGKHGQKSVVVDSVALDDFLDAGYAVDVIKMDIEGAEMAALLGMGKIIARSPELAIFTEFYPQALERAGVSSAVYFNELQRHEFKIYLIDEQRQCLEAVPDITYLTGHLMKKKIMGLNLLCVKGSLIDINLLCRQV